ncbi:MAG: type I secretion system permease/ATPase [Pseudomonadota bacterium]
MRGRGNGTSSSGDAAKTNGSDRLPEQTSAASSSDPLIECLDFVAREFALPFSRQGALAGLPMQDGRLTPALIPRAAGSFAMIAEPRSVALTEIPAVVLPVIVPLRSGKACVVLSIEGSEGRAEIYDPIGKGRIRKIELKALSAAREGELFFITPESNARAQGRRFGAAAEALPEPSGHWFFGPVRRAWPSWLQVIIAAFMINLLGLASPFFIMNVYDRVIPNFAVPTLIALALGVAIALFFDLILRQLRGLVLDRAGRRIDMRLASELFARLMRLRTTEHHAATGVLASQVREFDTIREVFTSQTVIAATDFLFIFVFIAAIWFLVGPLALVPLIAVPIVLLITLVARVPLSQAIARTQAEANRRHAVLVEGLVGLESLRAAGAEGVMQRKWEDSVAANVRAGTSTRTWSSLVLHLTTSIQQSVGVIIIVWGVFLVAAGTITIGGLIATNILAGRVLAPLANIAMTLVRLQQATGAYRSINQLMKLETEALGHAQAFDAGPAQIEFRNVTFTYPGGSAPAVSDVSLTIAPGEKVGIVGRIGSGKTTLGKLLVGFYAPDSGSIIVAGSDTRAHNPADLRSIVGYVGQNADVFAGTVRDNIVMGRPHATDADIARVARLCGVDQFTQTHPLGLMMPVGERGLGLSGGQKQAVALARILIRNPPVMFLDEPTATLDRQAEAHLVAEMESVAEEGRTLIVCTHRGAFLPMLDRLIVIDQGRIVMDGPTKDILKRLDKVARSRTTGATSPGTDTAPTP